MTTKHNQKLYHEKQQKQLCLLHTLNNLFQKEEFTKSELDNICENLDSRRWLNPHRSWLGLGNYDVNILQAALSLRNFSTVWFDSRCTVKQINIDFVEGYVLNTLSALQIPFYQGRHWFAVLRIKNKFYNLDSKLYEPVQIDNFFEFLNRFLSKGSQLLLVTKPENVDKCIIKNLSDT